MSPLAFYVELLQAADLAVSPMYHRSSNKGMHSPCTICPATGVTLFRFGSPSF